MRSELRRPGALASGFSLASLAVVLFYAVLAGGAVEPQDFHICLIAVGLLAALHGIAAKPRFEPRSRWAPALLAVPVALALLQLVPLPIGLLKALSPARAELAAGLDPLFGKSAFAPLSAVPAATFEGALAMAGYALVFLLTAEISRSMPGRPWALVWPLLAIGFFEAVLGLAQVYFGSDETVAVGTYANRNHFSGLLEMCLPFSVLYPVALLRRNGPHSEIPARAAILACAVWAGAAAMLLAIVYSLSRMGFLAALGSLMAMAVAVLRPEPAAAWKRWVQAAAVAALAAFAFAFLPGERLIQRLGSVVSAGELQAGTRTAVWRDTLQLIAAYPVFGCGLGAYESALMPYRTAAPAYAVDFAHNDYLQAAAELGLPGALLLLLVLAAVPVTIARAACHSSRPDERYCALACLGAFAAMALHSLADFNLHIPANAMALAWIGGVGYARALTARVPGGRR